MRICICHQGYRRVMALLEELLPRDEIAECAVEEIAAEAQRSDVLVPIVAQLPPAAYTSPRLRLIQQFGVGLDGVDIPAATAAGIAVANIPSRGTGNAESVAELTIGFLIMLARRIPEAVQRFHEGKLGATLGTSLLGSTVTIVGYGDIGQEVARRLAGFGCRIVAVSRSGPEGARDRDPEVFVDLHVDAAKLGDAVAEADFVVVAAPATPENQGLIGRDVLARMKPSAYLVNIARGPVIDYDAIALALREERIAGAALDVWWTEPFDPHDPLLEHNVIPTPHIGGSTVRSLRGIAEAFAAQIERIRSGDAPRACVNPEVWETRPVDPPL